MTTTSVNLQMSNSEEQAKAEPLFFTGMQKTGVGEEVILQLPNGDWIKPFGAYVILQIPKGEEKTKAGIFLPKDHAKQVELASRIGKVVAMGTTSYMGDRFPFGPWVKIGSYVMFRKYDAQDFDVLFNDTKEPFVILYDDKLMMELSKPDLIDTAKVIGR